MLRADSAPPALGSRTGRAAGQRRLLTNGAQRTVRLTQPNKCAGDRRDFVRHPLFFHSWANHRLSCPLHCFADWDAAPATPQFRHATELAAPAAVTPGSSRPAGGSPAPAPPAREAAAASDRAGDADAESSQHPAPLREVGCPAPSGARMHCCLPLCTIEMRGLGACSG